MAAMARQAPVGELIPAMASMLCAPKHVSQRMYQSTRLQAAARQEQELRNRIPHFTSLAAPLASRMLSTSTNTSMLSAAPRGTLRYASPLARTFSTATRLGPFALQAPPQPTLVGLAHQRRLFGSAWNSSNSSMNHNLLAGLEQTANSNPGSAAAQNSFYQALARANMPEIIVERYQTGRYATNVACDNVYGKAVERMGAAGTGALGSLAGGSQGVQHQGMPNQQLQSIGQAIVSRQQGGNVSVSRMGSGARSEPLYVVVDESWSNYFFKWFKFLLIFGAATWTVYIVLTMFIDITSGKKIGGKQNAEAKPELQTTRFTDVHGCDEAKEELQELVEFLKAPESFSTLGGKLPKGVLLVGPPGTGKTLLARAVAGESGVPFFYMSGSEFDEVYVGVGAKRVRDLFDAARSKSPAIIFIDELDAIGSKRHERDAAYAKQTLNQLLTELDGFDQNSGVIILGATNFPESLDKALTRPGRFDRNVRVDLPDVRGRIAILKHHMRNMRMAPDVDAATVARGCSGFSGAELENVVNQAAIRASKNKAQSISLEDLVWAKDKIVMGAERRSAVIQQKDKIMTAYHEGGHALVAMLTEASTPLYKATIMPRGHALGITSMLPEMDKVSTTKKELMASIDVAMGGKVAEELIYGGDNVTTGASSDITGATRIAYHMVTSAGMSEVLGNIDLADNYARLSPDTKRLIETEVQRLVEEGRARATALLTKNRDGLERLAMALVEHETLGKDDMEKVVRGEKLPDKLKVDIETPIKDPEIPLLPGSNGLPPAFGGKDGPSGGGLGGDGGAPVPPAAPPAYPSANSP